MRKRMPSGTYIRASSMTLAFSGRLTARGVQLSLERLSDVSNEGLVLAAISPFISIKLGKFTLRHTRSIFASRDTRPR